MPGIFGVSISDKNTLDLNNSLSLMQNSMFLSPTFIKDPLYVLDYIAASRVHLGKIGESSSPIQSDDLDVWVEGEAYNLEEVGDLFNISSNSIGSLILDAENKGILKNVLSKLDGYFCAAIYNKKDCVVKVITDRYGMKPLYWYFKDGIFSWASSVKAIISINKVDKTLDESSYDIFMNYGYWGYLIGDNTWFENIKLVKPSTILEFNIQQNSINQEYYWNWGEIIPSKDITFEDAVEKSGKLFIDAVKRRFNPQDKLGVSLSGGLDSRAIFAAINYLYPDYEGYAYTFGIPGCDDFSIAEKVVSLTNWEHKKFNFTSDNWFNPRYKTIWVTDGMKNMIHMQGVEFSSDVSKSIDVSFIGSGGDTVFGAEFLNKPYYQNSKVTLEKVLKFYNGFGKDTFEEDFYRSIEHFDAYLFCNEERRFTNFGQVALFTDIDIRKPFYDIKLLDFIYSLPNEYRINYKLYSAMLQKLFPIFLRIYLGKKLVNLPLQYNLIINLDADCIN